jgi:hypothetical protein
MKNLRFIALFLIVLIVSAIGASAQQSSNIVRTDLNQTEIDKVIKKFTENEFNFRQALSVYAFNRNAKIQTVGMGGQITGTYQRDSFMTFNQDGTRFEKILYFPVSTLTDITITAADIDNLGGIDPFAIEPKLVNQYNFSFIGKEKIDELDLYVFDVSPKVIPDWKKTQQKFFSGRIWVDDRDLMIVKSKGKAVPEGKERFAVMETWRDSVDGKYWFPVFSTSDDELVFEDGNVIKMRIRVKYANYRVGKTDVKILDDEQEVKDDPKPTPTPSPTPKKP